MGSLGLVVDDLVVYALPFQDVVFVFADDEYVGCISKTEEPWPAQGEFLTHVFGVAGGPHHSAFGVRNYIAVLITAILPALWLYRRIRHRTKPGHCVGCGYNLKGTMEAGRPAL